MISDWARLLDGNKNVNVNVAARWEAAKRVGELKRGRGRPRKENPKLKYLVKPSYAQSKPPKRVITTASDDETPPIGNRPKKTRRNFAKDEKARASLQAAIDAVLGIGSCQGRTGLSLSEAARVFGVPRSTLGDRLKAMEGNNCKVVPDYVKTQALPTIVEKKVVEVIKQLAERGFPVDAMHVKQFALKLFQALPSAGKHKNRFSASNGWWEKFMKRNNTQISRRRVQALQMIRADGLNPNSVSYWVELLGRTIDSLKKFSPGFGPGCIWNMDETGFSLFGTMPYGLVQKGATIVHRRSQTDQQLITALACIGDDGDWVHPMFVMKGVKLPAPQLETLKNQTSVHCRFVMSPNGWTSVTIFHEWCEQFVAHIDRKRGVKDTWNLLIMDGHGSHLMEPETMQFLLENKICALCLPAHTSSALQPCDVSYFKPVKTAYKRALDNHNMQNPGKSLSKWQVPVFAFGAMQVAATPKNIKSGFRTCGISPYDPDWVHNNSAKLSTASITAIPTCSKPSGGSLSFRVLSAESEKKVKDTITDFVESCGAPFPISPVGLVERNESITLAYIPQHKLSLRASTMACLIKHDALFDDSCLVAAIETEVFDKEDVFVIDPVLFKNVSHWYEHANGVEQLSKSDVEKVLETKHKGIWRLLCQAIACNGTLLFPIHSPGHWTFAAVLFGHKTIVWCDSYNPGKPAIVSSAKYTPLELIQFLLRDEFCELAPMKSRLQPNGYDCGAYVVRFAQIVVSNRNSDIDEVLSALQNYSSYFPVEGTGEFRKQLILKICRCFPFRNDQTAFGTETDLGCQVADHERRITALEQVKSKEHSDTKTGNTISIGSIHNHYTIRKRDKGPLRVNWQEVKRMTQACQRLHISHEMKEYTRNMVSALRLHPLVQTGPKLNVASQTLQQALASCAVLRGRGYAVPTDLLSIALETLAHLIVLKSHETFARTSSKPSEPPACFLEPPKDWHPMVLARFIVHQVYEFYLPVIR